KAEVNPIRCSGMSCAHPLSSLAEAWSVTQHNVAVARLLLEARAEVDAHHRSSGAFRVLELCCRSMMRIAASRTPIMVQLLGEGSTTPLGYASFSGAVEMVEILLDARADPNFPNERGHTPLQLAKSEEVTRAFHHHESTFTI
ncbi:unnamed protein product, partial [Effrenium voratum]